MLRSSIGLRSGVSQSRVRSCIGLRSSRPVRQPCLGVCAFKDWFAGLVQQSREPQQPQHSQQSSATAVHEPPAAAPQALQPAPKIAPKRDFLEARQVSLSQLFDSSDYKFDVPTYQRPYAWRTKQIYELLQDFVKAYESRQEYFLGAIVATRAAEGANVPYQLIDGQQRLTSLVLLLAFLHGWARQQGNEVLEGRFRRMLYLEADPLDPASNGRYRLRLRDADDQFFRDNVLDDFLPHKYRLTGLAAEAEAAVTTTTGGGGGAEVGAGVEAAEARPLENETWWRLYENASFLRGQLDKLVSEGLNLQDFAFHVLRNCFVVVMVARDEGASFRIFSTLNGRGMDLSMVDKLKADLLAGDLTPEERTHFAGAWAEMESVLGRSSFHRVFDHMRELAAVSDPRVGQTSVLEYFTRRVDDPAAVKQVLQVALDYARLLLQLRQASWATPELAALLAETPAVQHVDEPARSEAVQVVALEQTAARVLASEDVGRHEQHSLWQNQDGGVALPAAAAAVLRADVEAAANSLPETVAESAVEVEEEGGALVFRFDDPPAPAPITAAADADGDELLVQPAEPAPLASLEVGQIITRGPEGLDAAAEVHPVAEAAAGPQGSEAWPELDPAAAVAMELSMSAAAAVPQVDQQEQREDVGSAASPAHEDVQQLETSVLQAAASAAAALEELRTELREQAQQLLQGGQQQSDGLELQAEEDGAVLAVVVAEQEGQQPQQSQPQDPAAELQRQAALLAELDARSRHLNLFSDEAWLPPLLEFFYQTDDLQARAAFMKGAEALQLLLELQGDPAAKAARWGVVAGALLQRPFRPEAVLAALRLTEPERQAFRARLDSKDLYGTADQRTLRHLLVRCEPPSVSRSLAGLGGLLVERVVPQSAPEGSTWRKTRISSPCDPQSAWPDLWFSATPSAAAAAEPATASHSSPEQLLEPSPTDAAPTSPSSSSSSSSSYEVKYWYEVQRLNWHGKLGNLVLLPATAAGAASATSDYDSKAAVWRQAGVVARLPGFTGPLVDERGRYGRFRFCYDECRQRHADMLEFLVAEFEL